MHRVSTLSPRFIAVVVIAALLMAIGFLPLFGGPGYEHALASGLIVPSAAAILTSLELSTEARDPSWSVRRGASNGVLLAGVAFGTALIHGFFSGFCDLGGGARGFLLTAAAGSVLGGVWGAYAAERARGAKRRRLWCVLLSIAAPLLGIGVSVWRFHSSPMIFAFDPFVGYFSGTIYDTVIDPGMALLTYRLGTLATLTFAFFAASLLVRSADGALTLAPRSDGTLTRATLAACALLTSLAITLYGPALGHWQTSTTVMRDLGGFRGGARCNVVYPDTLREEEVALLIKDCDEELASIEKVLGARGPDRVTAFFFRDAGDKKRLMGAGDTYIAKPWRNEVYLQMGSYPHPVLGHELAHVVAGSFGRGPFRIAGSLGGLWPNPGLIEGVAVAASPDEGELTDTTWARAMLDLKILPPMERIFSVGFLGESSAKSYTLAGAFIRWLMDRKGADKVRALYSGATIVEATGETWAALDAAFRADLSKVTLPPEAESYAKAKFERPAIFGRRCPHVVDALRGEADHCRDSNQAEKAIVLYAEVLARDPHDFSALYGRALTEARFDNEGLATKDRLTESRGIRGLRRLAEDPGVSRVWRDRSEEAVADLAFQEGDAGGAFATYKKLAAASLDEDAARTLEVKAMAVLDPKARLPVRALLLGTRSHRGGDPFHGAALLGEWSAATHDPLADYLLGKNLAQHSFYDDAYPHLARVLSAGPPTARIHRETLRQLAIIACARGDKAGVASVRAEVEGPATPFHQGASGRYASIERLLDRCSVK